MSAFTIKIERPAHGGFFIGRHEGKIIMVKGAVLPGETVEVIAEQEKRDYTIASVLRIVEPSPDRIEPACVYYGICGGCQMQHVPYEQQVSIKREILKDCLRRLAQIETDISEELIGTDAWHYRLRAQFKVFEGAIGLHKKGATEVVKTDQCLLMQKEINEAVPALNNILGKFNIREIHITAGDSLIAQVITRGHALASAEELDMLASDLSEAGISGCMAFRGGNPPVNSGRTFTALQLGNLTYTISPPSFIQCNWKLNRKVVEYINNKLQPLAGKKILDLYAGAGNFSLPFALDAEVVSVEGNPYAIEDGIRNLELNGIKQCRFVRSSSETFQTTERFDIVILDPPRPGLSRKVRDKVLAMMPERIVYLSCNPSTFARDLQKLLPLYDIESITMIDFFPQTFHIETLAFLKLRA